MTEDQSASAHLYEIAAGPAARRALRRLPTKVAAAIVEFITGPLADNPHRLSKPLRNEYDGYRSARRGDYRVLLRVDNSTRRVLIIDIDHRAHIYRPR
ncbi:Plasmid stabilization system OS=Tsukamurella paurometabola (strain ATCC 8368 / DSM / CCUG 35730/ CIP 100753 / JCM 10117 / KCTC 9821 / NBRC 16120 / NCIMB 702349 / NCTC 13040) OX=521096 GN=Tpau_0239 PE=3 SV=1 [Tsukamurella paurometabola]|uniref:Plasmid stabilization system n=1 Tax=Tsukamurella paurometabola (strain ATCC 8368 / DSM 20162 / CCUG 35730 / CIP 100753 / JCM 10117 / KCTC 9821 / NBRC 16120 / NCIMB 702349 / NCTC 13040) TaxID=521096 RepID=D5UQQ6_TSUPD|nr:type II toxin-antitoxin system RelE/ParE family toxin [Tsukamurella paurometabola]ADG76889.1 plasmid stabilization system [Tsukamurella paurometabola DSM 20162]SUP42092.1 Toxin RelE [Tsukamurella paurometabola]